MMILQRRIISMLSNLDLIKSYLKMLLPVCWKYFQLMFIHCHPRCNFVFCNSFSGYEISCTQPCADEPFLLSTSVGDSVLDKRVYRSCPISSSHRVIVVDLVEIVMRDFDVMLGMDWLYPCYASIDCRTRIIRFKFPNESIVYWKRWNIIPRGKFL